MSIATRLWVGGKGEAAKIDLAGNVLNYPAWYPTLTGTTFMSLSPSPVSCTVTGTVYGVQGRTMDGDDFINCGDADVFSFISGSDDLPFAIDGWFKITNFDAGRTIISKYNGGGASEWLVLYSANVLYFVLYKADETASVGRSTPFTSANYLNKWVHIAATYTGNKSATGIKIYLNGTQVDNANSNTGTYAGMTNTAAPVRIGGRFLAGALNLPFIGTIGEKRIYNRALSASEIMRNYQETRGKYQ